jgi:hypothetical protein
MPTTNKPTFKDDPVRFARVCLRVLNKEGQVVPLIYKPAQLDYLANRGKRNLILKARQLGMSTVIQADMFREAITRTIIATTLAHEDATTQKLRRMVDRYYDLLPTPSKPNRKYNNDRLTSYLDYGSECSIATAGNKQTGRGGTNTHIHGSEVAYFIDAEAILAGLLQAGNPRIVLESTANGAQGWFYTACMEALDGRSDWKLHFYPWFWEPDYQLALDEGESLSFTDNELTLIAEHGLTPEQIKWRRSKQRELKHLFLQEYPEDALNCFLRSGFGYFGDLTGIFAAPHDAVPDETHRYYAGVDWGQANDFTDLEIIDQTTGNHVCHYAVNQTSWQEMRARVIALCKLWNVYVLVPETNSMGSTNIEILASEMTAADCKTNITPFTMTHESKTSIMAGLHEEIHQGRLRLLDDPILKNEFASFKATQLPSGAWQLAAAKDGHDDSVIATALANYAASGAGQPWLYIEN